MVRNNLSSARLPIAVLVFSACLGLAGCGRNTADSSSADARQQADRKNVVAAAIQYKAAVQKEPASPDLRLKLGRALIDAGDPAGAVVELSRALEMKASPDSVLPDLSRAMLLLGDSQKLTRDYDSTVLPDPKAQAALKSNLARGWAAQGNTAKAQAALAASLAAVPDFAPALILKASLMANAREYAPALEILDKVIARDGALAEAWLLKGEVLSASKGDAKSVREAIQKALAIDPSFVQAHAMLVSMELSAGNVAAAKAQADKLHALLPQHPQTFYIDALIAYSERNLPKAREQIQQALKLVPDNLLVLQLAGIIEAQVGSLVAAQTYLAKALGIDPELRGARLNLSRVYLTAGQAAKALETLQPLLNDRAAGGEAYALAGEAALSLGNPGAARDWFTQATKANPDDVRSKTSMLLTRLGQDDAAAVFADLRQLAGQTKDNYPDLIIVSTRLARAEYAEALAALDVLAKKSEPSAQLQELRGRVHLGLRDLAAARADFEKALQLDPKYYAAVSNLADLDVREKKPEQAQARIQAVIDADKGNYYARLKLARLRSLAGAPLDEVRKILLDATLSSPSAVEPRLAYIDFLLQKRLFKDALAAADEAASAFSNNATVIETVGRAQMEAGSAERAISTFGKLVGLQPGSTLPHLRLAAVYRAIGQRNMAESALKNALEIDPVNQQAQKGLLALLNADGRAAQALSFARGLQQKRPDQAEGYMLEASMLLGQGSLDASTEALRRGLSKAKNPLPVAEQLYRTLVTGGKPQEAEKFAAGWMKQHPEALAFQVDVGAAAAARGDLDRAEPLLTAVLAKQPNNAVALNNLAWVLVQRKSPQALAYAQRANDLLPDDPVLMDTLAQALVLEKRLDEAMAYQKRAVALAPNEHIIRLNLARLAVAVGDKPLAKSELDRLRALGAAFDRQDVVAELSKGL